MTTTLRSITARANGAKSKGPVTPAGKRNSANNATRHGMLAQTVVLEGESQDRFRELLETLTLQFLPRNPAEFALVETMAVARWRQMRVWGIQKAGFDLEMARQQDAAESPAVRAAIVFRHLSDNSRTLDLGHRYETAFDRQFARALALLIKLRTVPDESPVLIAPFSSVTWDFAERSQEVTENSTTPETDPRACA